MAERRLQRILLLLPLLALAGCESQPAVRLPPPPPRSPLAGHPHLIAADRQLDDSALQLRRANNGDEGFGGHRLRAMQLLAQARHEIRMAALFADRHRD